MQLACGTNEFCAGTKTSLARPAPKSRKAAEEQMPLGNGIEDTPSNALQSITHGHRCDPCNTLAISTASSLTRYTAIYGRARTPTHECPLSCRVVPASGTTPATQPHHRFYWQLGRLLRDSACGYTPQSPRNRLRLLETTELQSRPEDALNPPAHFLMRHKLAAIQRSQPFLHFPPEPFVMVQIICDKFLHNLTRGLTCLRSDPAEPRLNLRR